MPLGNSITYDENSGDLVSPREPEERSAYRCHLYHLLNQAGYNFQFIGSENSGWNSSSCGMPYLYSANAGFPGMRDQHLTRLLTDGYDQKHGESIVNGPYLDYYLPDIILLHIGTNDITHGDPYEVDNLISKINSEAQRLGKEIVVFLAKIINRKLGADKRTATSSFNIGHIQSIYNNRGNYEHIEIVLVDMENGANFEYTSADMYDDLHPNNLGYEKMAQKWFEAILTRFPLDNNPPVISNIPDQNTKEGVNFSSLDLSNYVSDEEDLPEDINWRIISPDNSTIQFQLDGAIINTSLTDENWFGTDSLMVIAEDNGIHGLNIESDTSFVKFIISPVNDPPEITGQNNIFINEDDSLHLYFSDIIYTDVDNDSLSLSINILDGNNYSYKDNLLIPDPEFSGLLTVGITISDTDSSSNQYNLAVTVIESNDIPTLNGELNITIQEDSTLSWSRMDLQIIDPDTPIEDIEFGFIEAENYKVYNDTVIVPYDNYHGQISVPIRLFDGHNENTNLELSVSIFSVNDFPFVTSIPVKEIDEGNLYSYVLKADDVDSETIIVMPKNLPSWLTFFESSNLLVGNAYSNNLYDTVSFNITDGIDTAIYSYSIKVNNNNDPPRIVSTPIKEINAGSYYEYEIDCYDADGDTNLLLSVIKKPKWLSLNNDTRVLQGRSNSTDYGYYDIELQVSDGKESSRQDFTLHVAYYNTAPEITSIPKTEAEEYKIYDYQIIASDDDNDSLTIFGINIPYWLTLNKSLGLLTGVPENGDTGTFFVEIGVTDLKDTTMQRFQISSKNVNDVPEIIGTKKGINVLKNTSLNILLDHLEVFDEDNAFPDDFTLMVYDGTNYTRQGNTIIPNTNYVGELSVPVSVSDGQDVSNVKNIIVNVKLNIDAYGFVFNKEIADIYPNPVDDYFYLTITEKNILPAQLEILSLTGKVILTKKITNIKNKIYLNKDLSGLYLIRLRKGNHFFTKKITLN